MKAKKLALLFAGLVSALVTSLHGADTPSVRLTEVEWHGVGCYKIEMLAGTVYFEKNKGVSGFKSFVDNEGKDWIASYLPPGPKGQYRGFPNAPGNFGHAGRDSGSTNIIVGDQRSGERVIIESSNKDFRFQYWFFPTHVSIKVLQATNDYCFLLETVIGGSSEAEDYFVTADGQKHTPTAEGEFDDFTPEWFYLGDPKAKNVMFLAKTPDDAAPNENHRQVLKDKHNMDLFSFGRTGKEENYKVRGMSGTEHVCSIGFLSAATPHAEVKRLVEGIMARPFEPAKR